MNDLRETLATAFSEAETKPETTTDAPAPATDVSAKVADAPEAVQSEVGAPVVSETPAAAANETKTIEEVVEKTGTEEKPVDKTVSDPRIDRAPASWKGEAKKLWAELPLTARQEVIRRERDTSRVLQESAGDRQKVADIQQVLAPHMDRIREIHQGNPLAAINNLLGIERTLISGDTASKAQMVANMINHFKIDISLLDSLLSGQAPSPASAQQTSIEQLLEKRLAPVMSFVQQQQEFQRQQMEQNQQSAATTVEQMSTDPSYPYFDEVRDDMADIIEMSAKRGVTVTLPEAYEKAVRMNDMAFQASGAREASQVNTQAALQAHQAAQKAKGAAVSVSGNPSGNGINAGNPADLRGTIATAFESMGGRI